MRSNANDRSAASRPGEGGLPTVDRDARWYSRKSRTRASGARAAAARLQLWFPARPERSPLDPLAGRLDGLTWRVTLAPDGEPLLYDTIHPCGCYHLFFPTPRARPRPAPDDPEEWMFAPQTLPRVAEGERPLVRLASGTHYIERVSVMRGSDSLARYALRPYGELRSLERCPGARASVVRRRRPDRGQPSGPSAICSGRWASSPRARCGSGDAHATAFVGRRHFDDADLIERRFRLISTRRDDAR